MSSNTIVYLCPGQGAQSVGMGRTWHGSSPIAAKTFDAAHAVLAKLPSWAGSKSIADLCFDGPAEQLDRTDVSQPALFVCGVACARALGEQQVDATLRATAGLSLGEYTALVIAGALDFGDGLRLVAERGRLMQLAAESSKGGMVALIGGTEEQASQICTEAAQGEVLVCANFNAPGQIVISGHATACDRAQESAAKIGVRASRLTVAGAFHSPLMTPAAEGLARALEQIEIRPPRCEVWSNVTAKRHDGQDPASIKKLLVEQLVSPVRWSQGCEDLIATVAASGGASFHEVAPGTVLKGLMRRINRSVEVTSHDQVSQVSQVSQAGSADAADSRDGRDRPDQSARVEQAKA